MNLLEQALGKRKKDKTLWRKAVAFTLSEGDRNRVARLAKHHGVNKSVLMRYLLLQEEKKLEEGK